MAKKLRKKKNFLQNRNVCFNQESLPITTISITKIWCDPKVNPPIDKDLNP